MALEQRLSLKLAQRLVMTPSLQQAIKLLQMTRFELEGVLSEELAENPILEESDVQNATEDTPEPAAEEAPTEEAMNDIDLEAYFGDYAESWEGRGQSSMYEEREGPPLENMLTREPDLYDHLLWQLHMMEVAPKVREIAELIIGNLDPEGFLAASVPEIMAMGKPSEDEELHDELAELSIVADALSKVAAKDMPGLLDAIPSDTGEDEAATESTAAGTPAHAEASAAEAVTLPAAGPDGIPEGYTEDWEWHRPSEGLPPSPIRVLRPLSGEGPTLRADDLRPTSIAGLTEGTASDASPVEVREAAATPEAVGETGVETAELVSDTDGELSEEDGDPVGGYPRDEVEVALALVRGLDPAGVACASLQESLLCQLERRGEVEDSLVWRMIAEQWGRFKRRKFEAIAKEFGVPLNDLKPAVDMIRTLETRPGRGFSTDRTHYVEPDVHVVKVGENYVVQINDDGLPRLRVSRAYRRLLGEMRREGRQADAQQYIKDKMRSAMWLIKSLDQRQRTIYKVTHSIVRQQRAFLDHGIEHLRPMVLRDVAEDIEMHESTVSRVVSNKYVHTPRGLFPLKFFFHSGIDREYGGDISSLTVKRKIEDLVQNEEPKKPLSDSELMRILKREGIQIARRTVAKYRDELGIPSSTDRKKIF